MPRAYDWIWYGDSVFTAYRAPSWARYPSSGRPTLSRVPCNRPVRTSYTRSVLSLVTCNSRVSSARSGAYGVPSNAAGPPRSATVLMPNARVSELSASGGTTHFVVPDFQSSPRVPLLSVATTRTASNASRWSPRSTSVWNCSAPVSGFMTYTTPWLSRSPVITIPLGNATSPVHWSASPTSVVRDGPRPRPRLMVPSLNVLSYT